MMASKFPSVFLPQRPPMTRRQQHVYEFVISHTRAHARPPSVREIMVHFKLSSPNGVQGHVNALCAKGYLERSKPTGARWAHRSIGPAKKYKWTLPLLGKIVSKKDRVKA